MLFSTVSLKDPMPCCVVSQYLNLTFAKRPRSDSDQHVMLVLGGKDHLSCVRKIRLESLLGSLSALVRCVLWLLCLLPLAGGNLGSLTC